MAQSKPYVAIVGGANVDICGIATDALLAHDSNIGKVQISSGGVGRNIAHNLALLGVPVRFISVFGGDANARMLLDECANLGIDTSASLVLADEASSSYLYISDVHGEMQLAINDMSILNELSNEMLSERLNILQDAALCVVDTNLSRKTLHWICESVTTPLFCDPISAVKAQKLQGVLGKLDTLKPNRLELATITGSAAGSMSEVTLAGRQLLKRGLKRAFVSCSEEGLWCSDGIKECSLPLIEGPVVNTNGAGDAMMAALIWARLRGLDLEESALAGIAASSMCVASNATVFSGMSEQLLQSTMRRARTR